MLSCLTSPCPGQRLRGTRGCWRSLCAAVPGLSHLLKVVAKERLLQITAVPSPTCSHAGSKGFAPSPWLHRQGNASCCCCQVVWKFFSRFPPSSNRSLNPSEFKHLLLPPQRQPFSVFPPHHVNVNRYGAFSLGSLPRRLFLDTVYHVTAQAFGPKRFVHGFTVKGWEVPSPFTTQMHELVPYKSCDLDLIIHVCLERNKKASVRLSSYFNDYSVWINYTPFGIFWKVCGQWCEIWFYKNRKADHSCDYEMIYSWAKILYLYWELRKSS